MLSTLKEIRDNIADTIRDSQVDSLIDSYINLTINELSDYHSWSFLRRKTEFSTVSTQEDYQLPRDVDRLNLIRQTTAPTRLRFVPDHLFYAWIPNPTAGGNPRYYRLWEEVGVVTQLTADDTIDVVSDSTADTQTMTITGLDDNGVFQSETYTINGTTAVTGSVTFSKVLQVSKSAATTGTITVTENSGSTTLVTLMPWERSPRFKTISLYPIPSSAITMYVEYYTRLKELVNVSDVPNIDTKWLWVIREGALAKAFQYQNKEQSYAITEGRYQQGLAKMKREDMVNIDYIPTLKNTNTGRLAGIVELQDSIVDSSGFAPLY